MGFVWAGDRRPAGCHCGIVEAKSADSNFLLDFRDLRVLGRKRNVWKYSKKVYNTMCWRTWYRRKEHMRTVIIIIIIIINIRITSAKIRTHTLHVGGAM